MNKISQTYIVAEAGVNHNGSLKLAKKLVELAAKAGADAVKFQTFNASSVISRYAEKAEYQKKTSGVRESQLEMVKKLQLSKQDHREILKTCRQHKIEFLSSPFDIESVRFLARKLKVSSIKIPSGEITNMPLLWEAAKSGLPVIMSTGLSSLSEVEAALSMLAYGYLGLKLPPRKDALQQAYFSKAAQTILRKKVILLHCTTEYPAPFDDVNLCVLDTLRQAFDLPVGLSDHTEGIAISIAAVARGASIIEKHFTLDRTLPGPDHKASIEFCELKMLVDSIRQVEKALGSSVKIPTPSEIKNKVIARKSLVVSRAVRKGEIFSEKNLTIKRPGSGIAPIHYWDFLGKTASRNYGIDELLKD